MANVQTERGVGVTLVHDVAFYRGTAELARVAGDFVEAGVAAGEPVLVAMPTHSLERVQPELRASEAMLSFQDLSEAGRNPARLLALFQEWADKHEGRVRVLGEPAWATRSRDELIECLRHEALVNVALAASELTMLCPYDAAGLDGEVLAWAEATHPTVLDVEGSRTDSSDYMTPSDFHDDSRWPLEEASGEVTCRPIDGDLRGLRQFVLADERVTSLGPARSRHMLLAVHEAATNALMYGRGEAELRIWSQDAASVCEVRSLGTFDDPLAGRLRPPQDAVSGRGLWLINQLCDLVELRSAENGTVVRMRMEEAG